MKSGGRDEFEGTDLERYTPRCYTTHPVLKLGKGILVGGSASYPVSKDADVYVALQSGSTCGITTDPWADKGHVEEIHFAITDGRAPVNVPRFKKMIDWLCNQLQAGKKVHVGCIGGHGRTGLVLAAIVCQSKAEIDAITWVRKHYCQRAVESGEQVKFLHQHYGIKVVEGSRSEAARSWGSSSVTSFSSPKSKAARSIGYTVSEPELLIRHEGHGITPAVREVKLPGVSSETKSFKPMSASRCIWHPRKGKA